MRLGRAIVGGAGGEECFRQAVIGQDRIKPAAGFAGDNAKYHIVTGGKGFNQWQQTVIGGFQCAAILTVQHEVLLVTGGHGQDLGIHRAVEHLRNGDIQRQANDRLGQVERGPFCLEILECPGHAGMDNRGTVDNGAVAIKQDQLHSSGSPAVDSSKPSRFQLCTMCGGNGAVTERRPPSG